MPESANTLNIDPVHARISKMPKSDPVWPSASSWAVLVVLALLFFSTSFGPAISNENEGFYAGAAREMHAHGDWLNPTNNGFLRIEKPPLVYWLLLCSTSLFGVNEFGLRFPLSLGIACWVGFIFMIMRRLGGERFGIAAALILSSMIGTRVFAGILQPEPFLALFSTGALWCLVEARFAHFKDLQDHLGRNLKASLSKWYWFLVLSGLRGSQQGSAWSPLAPWWSNSDRFFFPGYAAVA